LLGLVLVFAIALAARSWRRRRTNQRLVQGLAAGPSGAEREAQTLQQRFSDALKVLQESARQSGRVSWLRRSQFLYELPWYMFVGLPGSGKTTALLNAGLTFPLAAKMGQASIRGVGGTRNCEWWFTDQAVLIDTAGRYTSQDSDAPVDAAAWETFLGLLRKTRPRQPLNGVLLTINIENLLRESPADRKDHAQKLRSRLQELQSRLGVRPPVYVLVTKCDLIAGFNETFSELGREPREQVWGFSFPHDRASDSAAEPLENFSSEFAALGKRLRDGLVERMQSEPDLLRRAAIFSFPQQFEGLKGILGGFLEQVFEGGAGLEVRVLVRGVYFTSGTQEGSPVDRVLGALGRSFGVDQRPASVASSRGKAFFLTRLLKEVVFAERGLVGRNQVAESSRRRVRVAAWVAMLLIAGVLVVAWTLSYTRNLHYVSEVRERVPDVQAAVAAVPPATGAQLSLLPNALDKVIAAPAPGAFPIDDPPLTSSFGLYQGRYLGAGADIGYHKLLEHGLLPRVTRRVEERLRSANRNDLEFAYEALKAYVMLYSPEHFDPDSFKAWVVPDWEANLASTLSVEQRAALVQHLDAAISRGAPQPQVPMDSALVANVREMLIPFGLEFRILSRIKRARVGADFPEFSAAGAGGPNAIRVFERASGQPLHKGIPGLYTRDGYFKALLPAIQKVAPQLAAEEQWVLGVAAPAGTLKDSAKGVLRGGRNPELEARVQKLFLQEYIKYYDDYLRDVRPVRLDSGERGIAVAGLLGSADSPLVRFLSAVDHETQLGAVVAQRAADAKAGSPQLKTPGVKELNKLSKAKDDLTAVVGKVTGDTPTAPGRPVEMMVDDHFRYLHEMFNDKPPPPPIDETTKLFNNIFLQLSAIEEAKKSKAPPPAGGALAALKRGANDQPEPIKSMVAALVDSGATQGRQAERQGLAAEIKPVVDQCIKTIAGRYPFALGSKADVMPDDFGRMFGVGGQLDDFFQRKLSTLVDVGVTPWAYRPLADGTQPPGGASLADFQRAAKIREAFFRAGGVAPTFKVDLRLLEMDPSNKELVIDVDGQALKFVAGNSAAQTYTWPSPRVASQIKLTIGGATQVFEGPWAFFRMINQHDIQPSPVPERFVVSFNVEGHRARVEVVSASALNPLRLREMQTFRCPDAL
jgi:type VI secretion system protein ImpL